MGVSEGVRKGWVVLSLTLRYLLSTRRGIATAGLATVPVILTASLAIARVESLDILLFQVLMVPLFLQVVLIFVTLVAATALLREEMEDNTLHYLLTRPVSKPAVLASKYAGFLAAVLGLLILPLVVAYAITQLSAGDALAADLDVLGGFLVATVLGTAAYGSFFLLLSLLIRRPLAAGLLFGFLWESIVGSIPGDVPKLSIIHYLRSILKDTVAVGPLAGYPTDISAPVAAAILIGFSLVALVLSMFVFQQMEFKQKA